MGPKLDILDGSHAPIGILCGALAVSNLSFGLSRTFLALVVSRCIFAAFNSNAGVIKSIVGEITDHTNSAGFMYITAASPNKRSLGATNGLAETLVSVGKIVAPAMAGSLLAFSIQHDILWGHGVYVVFTFLTIGGTGLVYTLPTKLDWMDH